MTQYIQTFLKGVMDDILQQIHVIMASDAGINSKTGTNTLEESNLDRTVKGTVSGDTIDISFNDYIVYIEWNRPPKYGNKPPYSVILNWVKKKGIQPTSRNLHTVEELAWAIRYAIWRDGWHRRLIAGFGTYHSPLDEYIDKMWDDKWADELYRIIMREIERYFDGDNT